MTVGENTARPAESICWYFASATMTIGTPAVIASRNGARYASFGVVTVSTTAAVKSVFPPEAHEKAAKYLQANPPQQELSAIHLGRFRVAIKQHLSEEMQEIDKLVKKVIS